MGKREAYRNSANFLLNFAVFLRVPPPPQKSVVFKERQRIEKAMLVQLWRTFPNHLVKAQAAF